ncbi:MAG: DUF262 domain-containing protein [Cardiobacteriaceae bacterium]|nr:DUF262 domain-containing protein [Cardiobacteriaceae bacterium]
MEAKVSSFEDIFSQENKLQVPIFQRSYVWKKEHWEKLFDDLLSAYKTDTAPFLGSIILKRSDGNANYCNIIDGQQRLTSLSLLLKAIVDVLDEKINKTRFLKCLYQPNDKTKTKISHSYANSANYKEVLQTRYKQDTNKIQTRYKQDTNKIQTRYKQDTNKIQTR